MEQLLIFLKKIPFLYFLFAVCLFATGYAATLLLGDDNLIEDTMEFLLNRLFKITIEFSN
jgi:hypothetical protein